MKRIITILFIIGLGVITACSSSSPSKELNLYAWSEYIPQTLMDNFTKETGIKVNYDTYSSNEELMAKLQAGGAGYDLIIPSDYTIGIMGKLGMLEKIDLTKVSNFKNIDDKFKNLEFDPGNQYSIPYQWGTACLAVNTSKVNQPITKWADLWNPAFKDEIVLPDDSREVIGMVLESLGYDRNTTNPDELEQARQRFIELKPNIRLFDSDSPKTALITGEVWLGQVWNGEASLAHQENPSIDYVFPEEGCGIWFDNMAIPKSSPHVDAALKFMNYILEPQNSILITKEFPYSNPNKAALELLKTEDPSLYEAYMGFSGTNPSEEQLKRTHLVKDVGDATQLWDRIWTEVKGSQ